MFKDTEHLFRLVAVMLVGLAGFLLFRAMVVPKSFGEYGHFRGAALGEISARPIAYAGHATCEGCHVDVVDQKKTGRHKNIACEACHGAQAKHADDPTSVRPAKLNTQVLCARCHEANSAKPKFLPQVVAAQHAGDIACDTCHQPHHPKIDVEAKK